MRQSRKMFRLKSNKRKKIPHVLDGGEEPIKLIQDGKTYTSKYDKTKLSIKLHTFQESQDISGKNEIKILTLDIKDEVVAQKPFHRIDGNHRLKAAEESNNPKVENSKMTSGNHLQK